MAVNWATASLGATLVDCSSETESNEAYNILDPRPAKLWLSSEGLPQWLSISLLSLKDIDKRSICIRTIGWRCWHAYRTNPRKVTLHVSADGAKFRVWDKFVVPRPASGTHLFCCAPISIAIYPYIALEVTHTFGGLQTYINRVYLYTDEIPASPLSGSSKLESASNSTVEGQSDVEGDDNSISNSISIINVHESITKDIQEATQTNDDASFSLIDNLTSALEITRDDVKYIEKKGLAVEQINSNPSDIPITPATNMNFLETSTSTSPPNIHGIDRSTSPNNNRSLSRSTSPNRKSNMTSLMSSPNKKTSDQSTSPRRINSTDDHNNNHGIGSPLRFHNKINIEDDNNKINNSRIQFLEEKILKLEALLSSSIEIGNTMKVAKEETGRIRRHLNREQLRKGFADDSSDSSYNSDDDIIANNFKNIPQEKISIETNTMNDKVVDILENVDAKLSSLFNQVMQNEKNIELNPSLSNVNVIDTFDIDRLRRQYLSSNEIESLLNPTNTLPCYEIPTNILYGDISNNLSEPPQIPTSSSPSLINIDSRTIESELNERSEASFQAIGDLVKTLHMTVQKKIIKQTQLKLLKKKMTKQ